MGDTCDYCWWLQPRDSKMLAPEGSHEAKETMDDLEEAGFPLEGKLESQVECSHCHFKLPIIFSLEKSPGKKHIF